MQTTATVGRPRTVSWVLTARPTSDGDDVNLYRTIGDSSLRELDPFLLLDEFRSEEATESLPGFPDHPHRGFETVTYLLAGRVRHADNKGHQGVLEAGGVQWMTAGRGIVHSEMLEQQDGRIRGFQLWLNLPAKDKMVPPRYQEFAPEAIPQITGPNGEHIRVIAGRVGAVEGPVRGIATDPLYLDIALPPHSRFVQPVPVGHTAFVYIFEGQAEIGAAAEAPGEPRGERQLAVLGDGDSVTLVTGETPARLLLVAARPLDEPVVRYGPFVMNTQLEIWEAVQDYHTGKF
ncbi:pirin family protein [Gloeobacter violaceus]|uniref:Glr2532 protein n=1 Tax=Gloeobacter violaceus (strain ATCC 29082 / PCC 7421) TaxID=251221 RepID=Q7NHK3_GLOVI|nr:pirin family protein [Gloeobacter violaceus]BAC90473.1 glr2532 [Gloeobacter violaceus PCC 7421]